MTDSNKCDENIRGCTGDPTSCELDPSVCQGNTTKTGHTPDTAVTGKTMEECMGKSMETLSSAFTASARRWEMIVYPSLFAFILLAAYGFYLIYNLTYDVKKVAANMDSIATYMQQVAQNMDAVSRNMVVMTQTVDSQSASMHEMTLHMRHMSVSMGPMRYDLSIMNNSVSRPMQFMNTFMPW